MKRGHKRLLVFQIITLIILFLNSFVWNILSGYKISIFIAALLLAFKFIFGFEKDKHRYTKDLLMEVIIFLVVFFILYYLFGIIISFYRPGNYFTLDAMKSIVIPTVLYIVLKEYLRYVTMCKAEGSKILFWSSVLLFIMLDITNAIYIRNFATYYMTFLFIAITVMPAISSNTVLCYFTRKTGYKPLILYLLIFETYTYFVPIAPNPNQYITSVINFVLPILFAYRLHNFFNVYKAREINRNYKNKHLMPLIASCLIIVILVYFTSGYFHYWAIAVASGSMSPQINKGDVVIIEKLDGHFESLEKGQVIAFKYENVIVVHRLINIIKDKDEYYFYTKGDFNSNPDNFVVKENMVIGTVNKKIPFIGLPTVWVNELF